jgi:DNA repair protein RadC
MEQQHSEVFDPTIAYSASATCIKNIPTELRPREEFVRRGGTAVADEILIAILLRSGTPKKNVIALARELLVRAGGMAALSKMGFEELLGLKIKGLGPVKAMELAAAIEIGRRACARTPGEKPSPVREPASVYRLAAPLAHGQTQEVFWVLLLDIKNCLIGRPLEATRGLINSSPVHPREVFNRAIRHAAAAVILVHNHPSGDPTPSAEDITITKRLVEAARIIGIKVLDHVVVGAPGPDTPGYLSLRERGLVNFDA